MAASTPYVLGLDLGTSSIGWAIIDFANLESCKPVSVRKAGVRIFDAGVEGDVEQGKDSSRAAQRREARQPRRQHWRRQQRKRRLFRLLQMHRLLPKSNGADAVQRKELFDDLDSQIAHRYIQTGDHVAQQKLPYLLRKAAASTQVSAFELGRALYHLAQRRGYLSNRKGQDDDEREGKVAAGIGELAAQLSGRTLGEFFADEVDPTQRSIRRRYTARSMYREEFDRIRQCLAPFSQRSAALSTASSPDTGVKKNVEPASPKS